MNHKLYFFWIPRTGGTFIWQVLKSLMSPEDLWYDHDWIKTDKLVIITYRNSLDMIASQWRIRWGEYRNGKLMNAPNKIELERAIDTVKKQHLKWNECLTYYTNTPNVLFLKYEDFYRNYRFLFSKIENLLKIVIADELKNKIIEDTNISKNIEISNNITLNKFGNWDRPSRIHARHIYNRGEPGTWKEIIPKKFHSKLLKTFKHDLEDWGYNE